MPIANASQPVQEADRNYALAIHLSPLAALVVGPAILAPVVLWLIRRHESGFVEDHGRETTNAVLSFLLYNVLAVVTLVGVLLVPVLFIAGIVSVIRGAIAAGRGEYFRYPMTIRFLG